MLHVIILYLSILIVSSECFAQPNWNISPSVTISEAYNSNILSNETEMEDYITRTGADINVLYYGTNMDLSGNYLVEFSAYSKHPEENVVTHDIGLTTGLNRWFGKIIKGSEINITEDFTYRPDLREYLFSHEREDIYPLNNYGLRTKRSDTYMNAAEVNASIPLTNRLDLSLSYTNLLTEYKAPDLWDNVTNTTGLRVEYSLPKNILYSDITFSIIRVGFNDSTSYSFSPGVRHSISDKLIFDINAGLIEFNPEVGEREISYRGNIRLTKQSRFHTLNAGYSRSLNTVTGVSQSPPIADLFFVSVTNIHSSNLTSNIGVNYIINTSIIDRHNNRDDINTTSYNISGGLSYVINSWLQCSFTVSHFDQRSDNLTTSDIRREQVIFSITGRLY